MHWSIWLYVVVPVLAAIGLSLLLLAVNDWLRRFWALEHAATVHRFEHRHLVREHVHHMGGGKYTSTGGPEQNVPLMRGTSVAFTHVTECSSRAVGDEGGL